MLGMTWKPKTNSEEGSSFLANSSASLCILSSKAESSGFKCHQVSILFLGKHK